MLPNNTVNYPIHMRPRNSKPGGEFCFSGLFLVMCAAYFIHVMFLEFCAKVVHSSWATFKNRFGVFRALGLTSLGNFVCHVVGSCSLEKMPRIHAVRIVAFVANQFSLWNFTIGKFPRNPMGFFVTTIILKGSVAFHKLSSFPHPAWAEFWTVRRYRAIFIYFTPKQLLSIWCHHKENARQLESKVRSHSAAIESTGVENRFMAFLTATLMPRKSYTTASNWSTLQAA